MDNTRLPQRGVHPVHGLAESNQALKQPEFALEFCKESAELLFGESSV